jgi:hypothetical protein
MSDITEEEIARLADEIERELYSWRGSNDGVYTLRAASFGIAQKVLALLQPALERARVALTDEQDHLLMCAIENLRSADRSDRTVEAAWRMAEKMEAWRKAAAIRKG